jgi:hypothetical protein
MHRVPSPAARQTFFRVFAGQDPFASPFRASVIPAFVVFYPTDFYHLTQAQWSLVFSAAGELGDPHATFGMIEAPDCWAPAGAVAGIEHPFHAVGPDDHPLYKQTTLALESALWGVRWGVMTSHLDHALVGGPPAFLDRIRAGHNVDRDLATFLHATRQQRETPWYQELAARAR